MADRGAAAPLAFLAVTLLCASAGARGPVPVGAGHLANNTDGEVAARATNASEEKDLMSLYRAGVDAYKKHQGAVRPSNHSGRKAHFRPSEGADDIPEPVVPSHTIGDASMGAKELQRWSVEKADVEPAKVVQAPVNTEAEQRKQQQTTAEHEARLADDAARLMSVYETTADTYRESHHAAHAFARRGTQLPTPTPQHLHFSIGAAPPLSAQGLSPPPVPLAASEDGAKVLQRWSAARQVEQRAAQPPSEAPRPRDLSGLSADADKLMSIYRAGAQSYRATRAPMAEAATSDAKRTKARLPTPSLSDDVRAMRASARAWKTSLQHDAIQNVQASWESTSQWSVDAASATGRRLLNSAAKGSDTLRRWSKARAAEAAAPPAVASRDTDFETVDISQGEEGSAATQSQNPHQIADDVANARASIRHWQASRQHHALNDMNADFAGQALPPKLERSPGTVVSHARAISGAEILKKWSGDQAKASDQTNTGGAAGPTVGEQLVVLSAPVVAHSVTHSESVTADVADMKAAMHEWEESQKHQLVVHGMQQGAEEAIPDKTQGHLALDGATEGAKMLSQWSANHAHHAEGDLADAANAALQPAEVAAVSTSSPPRHREGVMDDVSDMKAAMHDWVESRKHALAHRMEEEAEVSSAAEEPAHHAAPSETEKRAESGAAMLKTWSAGQAHRSVESVLRSVDADVPVVSTVPTAELSGLHVEPTAPPHDEALNHPAESEWSPSPSTALHAAMHKIRMSTSPAFRAIPSAIESHMVPLEGASKGSQLLLRWSADRAYHEEPNATGSTSSEAAVPEQVQLVAAASVAAPSGQHREGVMDDVADMKVAMHEWEESRKHQLVHEMRPGAEDVTSAPRASANRVLLGASEGAKMLSKWSTNRAHHAEAGAGDSVTASSVAEAAAAASDGGAETAAVASTAVPSAEHREGVMDVVADMKAMMHEWKESYNHKPVHRVAQGAQELSAKQTPAPEHYQLHASSDAGANELLRWSQAHARKAEQPEAEAAVPAAAAIVAEQPLNYGGLAATSPPAAGVDPHRLLMDAAGLKTSTRELRERRIASRLRRRQHDRQAQASAALDASSAPALQPQPKLLRVPAPASSAAKAGADALRRWSLAHASATPPSPPTPMEDNAFGHDSLEAPGDAGATAPGAHTRAPEAAKTIHSVAADAQALRASMKKWQASQASQHHGQVQKMKRSGKSKKADPASARTARAPEATTASKASAAAGAAALRRWAEAHNATKLPPTATKNITNS